MVRQSTLRLGNIQTPSNGWCHKDLKKKCSLGIEHAIACQKRYHMSHYTKVACYKIASHGTEKTSNR
jgi:hypothetical protein